jgi:hypothetical protein
MISNGMIVNSIPKAFGTRLTMIRILRCWTILSTALACQLWAVQTAAPPLLYVESFRHGATRVTEKTFEAQLTPQNPVYREPIKDVRGNDRYVLSLAPLNVEGDIQIVSWEAKLADLQHRTYANVLMASQIPSDDPVNNAWWLDPGKFARVPVLTARIIKVDGFYVVLKVVAYHFTPSESPYLDSMTVQVNITNTDPRAAKNSGGSGAGGSVGSTDN